MAAYAIKKYIAYFCGRLLILPVRHTFSLILYFYPMSSVYNNSLSNLAYFFHLLQVLPTNRFWPKIQTKAAQLPH